MVESGRDTERIAYEEGKDGGSISQGLGFARDPSFSGWFDEDEIFNSDDQEEDASAAVAELNFVLPLLQKGGLENGLLEEEQDEYSKFNQRGLHVNDSNSMDVVSTPVKRNASEKHATFDIEYAPERELDVSDNPYSDTDSVDKLEASPHDPKNPISIADVLRTLFFILVWYTFSTFLTLYNKTLLGDDMGRFPAPLLMNTVHFAMQAILSNAITFFWSQRFPTIVLMSWRDYFMRVVPTALGTAMDINLSNASLVFISVTFATMCKSASPIFLLIFAFAFRLESPSVRLLGIILIISVGILLTVARETKFDFWGFIFVMLAAVMSGFRWSMTQILLQKEVYGLKNPLTLMSYVTPVMAIATALFSFIMDPWDDFKQSNYFNTSWHTMRSCLLMLFGGTLAFFMVLTEYILVSVTSAMTVTIAGVVKEVVTILVAVFYFHDEFTWLKGAGLITIMFGVSLFNWYKYQKLQKGKSSQDDLTASPTNDVAAKYVILEEMDDEVDVP